MVDLGKDVILVLEECLIARLPIDGFPRKSYFVVILLRDQCNCSITAFAKLLPNLENTAHILCLEQAHNWKTESTLFVPGRRNVVGKTAIW